MPDDAADLPAWLAALAHRAPDFVAAFPDLDALASSLAGGSAPAFAAGMSR